jgi:effector-binding domain-containing protein
MNNIQEKEAIRQRMRSPGYPMISLEEAVQKTKILWDQDKNNSIPKHAAFEHLGYKKEGGYGARVISALKQFGLISDTEGDIKLTNEAVDLALHEQHDDIYIETIKKLAIKPIIYAKLYNEYNGNLPSDTTLKARLIKDEKFNADKVNGFISDFRRTIEFANLYKSEEIHGTEIPATPGVVTVKGQGTLNRGDAFSKENKVNIGERVIATYTIGRGLTARIIISGEQPTTIKSIEKLLNRMQEDKDDMIESIDDDKAETTEN